MFLLYHLTDCCLVSLPLFSNHSEFIRTKISCVSLELNASNEKIIWYPHDVVKSNFYLHFNNLDKQSPTNILCLWVCVPVFKDLIPGLPLYYSVFLAKWSNIGASLTGFFTCYCILFSFFFYQTCRGCNHIFLLVLWFDRKCFNFISFCRFCDPGTSKHCRHEMALDANGRKLLVTSGSVRAPIYQVKLSTPPHPHPQRTLYALRIVSLCDVNFSLLAHSIPQGWPSTSLPQSFFLTCYQSDHFSLTPLHHLIYNNHFTILFTWLRFEGIRMVLKLFHTVQL